IITAAIVGWWHNRK
ncbi:type I toxin-antitoxin system toxin Ldr family protein, partial [Shigella flexneri]|nr:type I toxin-antitoxin system toxin Ldr family protein [Shigella flexneri]